MVMPFRIGFPPNGGPPPPQMPSYVQFRPNFRQRPPMRQPPPNSCLLPEENLLFVGNIDERVPNDLLHAILDCCGPLEKWQRLVGPDGRLPAFGFVGYKNAESAILCLKAMHNFRIGNKALNVRPDEKVRQTLFDHVRRERALQNLPRKQIGTELEIEEHDKEIVAQIHEKATEVIRDTHAHLLVVMEEEKPKVVDERGSLDRRSRTPRSDRRKRKKGSRSRRSESRDKKRSKRHRSSSASSTRSSRRESTSGAESDDSDMILERKLRKREQKRREEEYLRQLKKFEERERRRAKLYSHEDEEDMILQKTIQKEAKKLAQFLEDYNDDRDDPKYYRSSSFYKRKQEYDRERDLDRMDREDEARELAAMKENMQKEDKEQENGDKPEKKESKIKEEEDEESFRYSFVEDRKNMKIETTETSTSQNGADKKVVTSFQQKIISQTISVFGEDDPDEENTHVIKKKIKKFEITHQERMESLTSEERRQMAKDLINEIPTTKEELFAHPLDWEMVDQSLVDEKIRPWVDKKIREYIGEEELTLVRFICEKVAEHGEPQRLLGDLAMILDDEAEAFVFKLWRLIIFQSKAKRIGLNVNNRS